MEQKKKVTKRFTIDEIVDMSAEAMAKVIAKLKDPSLLIVAMMYHHELSKLMK